MSDVAAPGPMIDQAQRDAIRDCLGDAVVGQLVSAFWHDLQVSLAELLASLDGRADGDIAERVLHTLKGSAGTLGYAAIAAAAQAVRSALHEGVAPGPSLARLRGALRQSRGADTLIGGSTLASPLDHAWERMPQSV